MPLIKGEFIGNEFQFVCCDYGNRDSIWLELSKDYIHKYGEGETDKHSEIQERLKHVYVWLGSKFDDVINGHCEVAFLMFMFNNHDTLCQLWIDQERYGEQFSHPDISEQDLKLERRINKIIIEQISKHELVGCTNVIEEIAKNNVRYIAAAELLLYIGVQLYIHSNYLAENQISKDTFKVICDSRLFRIEFKPGYPEFIDHLRRNLIEFSSDVVVQDYTTELRQILCKSYELDYGIVIGNLFDDGSLHEKLGFIKLEQAASLLHQEFGYTIENVIALAGGLIMHPHNINDTLTTFYKNQDSSRFLFRPIIHFISEGRSFYKTSFSKYLESIHALQTMGLAFNHAPGEWLAKSDIKEFVERIVGNNDKILEDPAFSIISEFTDLIDRGVKSLVTAGNNINIDNAECGEIDILFYSPRYSTLFVCECKHMRQRTDMVGWLRDIRQFRDNYESVLERKIAFIKENIQKFVTHLELISSKTIDIAIKDLRVEGIFVINMATLYMFDAHYKVYTLSSLKSFCSGNLVYGTIRMHGEEGDFDVNYPYIHSFQQNR